ncbi:MAG TPA: 2'-5' RNA ligase family protein [Polyangiaceae bacterium]
MPRPNWFFAFPIAGAFLRDLTEPPTSIRLYHPDDAHLTLAFLGGCTEEAALRALAALDARLASDPPPVLDVALGEVVPLGRSKSGYTTLSALLSSGREEATALLTAHRDPLHEAATGTRPKRPAKPHVTLARVRGRASAESREAGLAWAASLDLRRVRVRLERIALYTWAESRKERLFRIVTERRLNVFSDPT